MTLCTAPELGRESVVCGCGIRPPANAEFWIYGGLFSCQCMRLEVLGGVVVVANGWAESRWRLRMLCDLPQRFERCYSAEDRMFDGLQACIIVIL